MKIQLAIVSLGLSLATGMSASAGKLTFASGFGTLGGGEFTIATSTDYGSFKSFCLEYNEDVLIPGTYDYAQNSKAVNGGIAGGSPDPLSVGTAYLFSQFATGNLSGYSKADENDLQQAIWWLEDEVLASDPNKISGVKNSWVTLAQTALGNLTDAQVKADATPGSLDVYVLNLTFENSTRRAQDILVFDPVRVPDGGLTLGMLGTGMIALGLARRRLA